jgi:glyoxylase I family protein
MDMSSMAFHHVAISCKDPVATERYYTQHFGFRRARVIPLGDDQQIVFLKNGGAYLELFKADGASGVPAATQDGPHYPAWRHIAFIVDDVDAKVTAMGRDAQVTLGPLGFDSFIPGWRTVWLSDPDGNIVEISQGYTD